MRIFPSLSALAIALTIAACGPAAAPSNADAQTSAGASTSAPAAVALTAADRAAMLHIVQLTPDGAGKVVNACGDKVDPTFTAVDLAAAGVAQLMIIPGGPSAYTCYGDGPGDMHLFRRNGTSYSEIFGFQAGFLVVLPSKHGGANDIVIGGGGLTHPVYWWNGTTYANHGEIGDDALGNDTRVYPAN